jgi:hypothetical protein
VGYPDGTKAWTFWDPIERKLITSSHAVFDERIFPGNTKFINVFGVPVTGPTVPAPMNDDDDDEISLYTA